MPLDWSAWRRIDKPANYNQCAVYKIRLCSQNTPVRINRFLDIDERGLLCIGKTTDMEDRREKFVNSLNRKVRQHSEGNRRSTTVE
jgi:hypothetical protein